MNLRVGFKKFSNIILKSIAYYSCFHVGFTYLIPIDFHICNGSSMEPTLRNNDILLTEKSSVRRLHIKKDDIVILKSPCKSDQLICKRVYDSYKEKSDPDLHIPYGYVYLAGDNSDNSKDSRDYGSVPYGLIQSRVFLRIWPLNDIKLFAR